MAKEVRREKVSRGGASGLKWQEQRGQWSLLNILVSVY